MMEGAVGVGFGAPKADSLFQDVCSFYLKYPYANINGCKIRFLDGHAKEVIEERKAPKELGFSFDTSPFDAPGSPRRYVSHLPTPSAHGNHG